MITVSKSTLIDNIMAMSALRGDITGRGTMLVDNDDAALGQLLATVVPAALARYAIDVTPSPDGWTVHTSEYNGYQLMAYLSETMLHYVAGQSGTMPALSPAASASSVTRITGYFA